METIYTIDYSQPMLFLAIHNGHNISDDIRHIIGISESDRLREEDPFTDSFIKDKPNHIIQTTSRFAYDLNRSKEHAVYQTPEDCWGLDIYPATKLTSQQIERSMAKYEAFYTELDKIIERFLKQHQEIIVWDVHSYNHRRGGINAPFDPEIDNPEVILGTNYYKYMPEKWRPLVDTIEQTFKAEGFVGEFANRAIGAVNLDVRQNVKFPGGYLSQYVNKTYGDRVCCIAVEFKKIWMNEWTGEVDAECLQRLHEVFARICEYIKVFLPYGRLRP